MLQKTVIIDNSIYSQKSVSEQERTFESALSLIHITPITAYFMEGGVPMTEVDRDIALVLLKRLWKRELISEETYVSACNSRFFDKCRFTSDTEAMEEKIVEEDEAHDDGSMAERTDEAGQVDL